MAELPIRRDGNPRFEVKALVSGSHKAELGHLAMFSTDGYLREAADVSNGNCVGVFETTGDNSEGTSGDPVYATIGQGIYHLHISGTADGTGNIDKGDVGKMTYVVNSTTVSLNTGSNSVKAGPIVDLDGTFTAGVGYGFIDLGQSSNR